MTTKLQEETLNLTLVKSVGVGQLQEVATAEERLFEVCASFDQVGNKVAEYLAPYYMRFLVLHSGAKDVLALGGTSQCTDENGTEINVPVLNADAVKKANRVLYADAKKANKYTATLRTQVSRVVKDYVPRMVESHKQALAYLKLHPACRPEVDAETGLYNAGCVARDCTIAEDTASGLPLQVAQSHGKDVEKIVNASVADACAIHKRLLAKRSADPVSSDDPTKHVVTVDMAVKSGDYGAALVRAIRGAVGAYLGRMPASTPELLLEEAASKLWDSVSKAVTKEVNEQAISLKAAKDNARK